MNLGLSINIKIGETVSTVSLDEAKKIYEMLKDLFDRNPVVITRSPIGLDDVKAPEFPWGIPTAPIVKYSNTDRS